MKGTFGAAGVLVLCCCLGFSCSKTEVTAPVSNQKRLQIHPTHVMVIVRDIEGFFVDCGCSSTATGGLARIPGVAPTSSYPATFVLAGSFLAPKSNDSALQALALNWPHFRSVLSQLGPTVVAGTSGDRDFITSRGGLPPNVRLAEPGQRLLWADGFFFSIGLDGQIRLEQQNRVIVARNITSLGARARQAMVLGVWNSSSDLETTAVERLGPAYLKWALAGLEKDEREVRSILEARSQPVVSSYLRELGSLISELASLADLVADLEMRLSHSTIAHDTFAKVQTSVPGCAGCHENAYAVWKDTRHAGAMRTLHKKDKHGDARCVPCHSSTPDEPHPAPVSCVSCHREPGQPPSLETCKTCHTPVTDPQARYVAGMGSVCIKRSGKQSVCPGR